MNGAPSFGEAVRVWAKIGVTSFGGPAGQIALMHRVLVEERRWLDEQHYLHALNFCMLLPGPEAMQLATYAGWLLHGWRGGLVAGLLFVLPGAVIVVALSAAYAAFGAAPIAAALFLGVKAAVLAIVVEALLRIARRALKRRLDWVIAGAAFCALFLFAVPFPAIVLGAALIGFVALRPKEEGPSAATPRVPLAATMGRAALWLVLWWAPLALLALGPSRLLVDVGLFFSKLAVVTFGGAYAVLSYMAQQAVELHGWLSPAAMIDGLGLAETTPGPLILVTAFVAYQAGFGAAGHGLGLAAAMVALWATFVPCFLWIFVGAPYIERLRGAARLRGALAAITAAVVGVILNLSLWFALHVVFAAVETRDLGPLRLAVPNPASLDAAALALVVIAAVLLLAFKLGVLRTLAACAALGIGWSLLA
ncbi:MAG: chromate efflux transporter [Alphaproteobacteria bacterium]